MPTCGKKKKKEKKNMMVSMSIFTCTAQLNSMHVDSQMIAAFGDDDKGRKEGGGGRGGERGGEGGTVRRGVRKRLWEERSAEGSEEAGG